MEPSAGTRFNVAPGHPPPIELMRRQLLLPVALAFALTACANRPPPPPLKPNSYQRLGMLDTLERKASRDVAPLSTGASVKREVANVPWIAYNPATLGMAIGTAIRASQDADYNALAEATALADLNVLRIFQATFDAEIARIGLKTEAVSDAEIASRLRDDNYKQAPTAFDGIIDIQIRNVGYTNLGRGRGFAPQVSITARMLDMVNAREAPEDWSCDAPAEPGDPGYADLTFPSHLTMPALASFGPAASRIRPEFTRVIEFCGRMLASDIARFQQSQARNSK